MPDRFLVHADLHNHTALSDGDGDPYAAYDSMRAAGLDVAAITDHAYLSPSIRPSSKTGLDELGWKLVEQLSEAAGHDGTFVALRGFEWSHPYLGHINIWGSRDMTWPDSEAAEALKSLWQWLLHNEGAQDGLISFNHPGGRGAGRFDAFRFDSGLQERLVGLEIYNKADDYLFQGVAEGKSSPLVECLSKGWRPALLGVSDEHGDNWGHPIGKGRTGLWVKELTAQGVREALVARACFAAREKGLRLACLVGGVPMGAAVSTLEDHLDIAIDLELPTKQGVQRPLDIQVLGPGDKVPAVLHCTRIDLHKGSNTVTFSAPWRSNQSGWIVLRISDPSQKARNETYGEDLPNGKSIAYTSPVWIN